MSNALEGLHWKLRSILPSLGYERLLPVQEKAIPVILSGHHTLIVAPTGSGKTEAALLPILSMMLWEQERGTLGGGIKVVYVTPLRALNRDIASRIERLAGSVGFTVQVRHGDTGPSDRRRFLESPPDIVITTPESLNLLLTLRDYRSLWSNVGWVVVDEVHEMLESERGSELSVILERLQVASRRRIQRIGLSATLSQRSARLAAELLAYGRHVEIVEDPAPKVYDVRVEVVDASGDEKLWEEAVEKLADVILSTTGSTLVFVNTRYTAELLAVSLSKLLGEGSVVAHHGSLSRHVREKAEADFKEGRLKALVATSSMELGVDIGRVSLVAQFLSPRQAIVMTQRAGRAGHRLWEVSRGVIVTVRNIYEMMESGVIAYRVERGGIEDVEPHTKPYDALAHQLVAMVVEGSASSLEEAYRILTSTQPYSNLTLGELEEIARHLESVGILRVSNGSLAMSRRTLSYLYSITMIPDEREYEVVNIVDGRRVGRVSERFIEWHLARSGVRDRFRIVLAGRVWEVLEVNLDEEKLVVKPIGIVEGYVPVWEGELIPVSYKVAREVCSVMELLMEDPVRGVELLKLRKLGSHSNYIVEVLAKTREMWGVGLSHVNPVIEDYGKLSILHVCLGSKGNFALAILLSKLMEKYKPVEFKFIPYAVIFESPTGVPGELVRRALLEARGLDVVERAGMIYDAVKRSKAYLVRFHHVAKRMGVLDADARINYSLLEKLRDAYAGTIVEREALRETVHDKVDLRALNEFLDSMREPVVVKPRSITPLAEHVLSNPYVRGDVAVNVKVLALDQIIEAKRRHLEAKEALMLCTMCGHSYTRVVRELRGKQVCPKCGSSALAPLPSSDWGRSVVEVYRRSLAGGTLSREERKLVEEVRDRAGLYLNYATHNLGEYVVKALMTHGVGPKRARRVLDALVRGGERAFYEELLRAEEEYVTTRKYWSSRSQDST